MTSAVVAAAAWADQGVVREIVDSKNGYLYVQVDKSGTAADKVQEEWLAVGDDMKLKPGDTISFDEGMVVTSFRSEALQRSFATLRFVMQAAVIEPKTQPQ